MRDTTGHTRYTLAKNEMGAIVTHALITEDGDKVIAAESGELLFWDLETKTISYSDE